jgi:hypothetical protein
MPSFDWLSYFVGVFAIFVVTGFDSLLFALCLDPLSPVGCRRFGRLQAFPVDIGVKFREEI